MFGNNKIKQEFTEKYLETTKKNALRFWILVYILLILVYITSLSFMSGYLAGNKYGDFNALANLTASGLLSVITGAFGYFYGLNDKKKDDKVEVTE